MGQYTCIASNAEGEGESNQALLEIQCKQKFMEIAEKFSLDFTRNCFCFFILLSLSPQQTVAPICRPGQVQTYNVGRGETAQIHCEVEGIPRDISFVWKFNTSVSEMLDMPSSIVKNNSTRSTINFKPMTEHVIWKRRFLHLFDRVCMRVMWMNDDGLVSNYQLKNAFCEGL